MAMSQGRKIRPIDLVAAMVLDNRARWGEAATPDQWADMRALLEPGPGEPRRHFWLRARGRSKTFDAGAATLAVMLAGGVHAGDEMYAAAEDKTQAGLLAEKIRAIGQNTPGLANAAEVQQYRVITSRTGAVLNVLSSELAGSWGKTPRWLFVDEVCNHTSTEPKRQFISSLTTALVKRPDSVCLIGSTPSSPSHWAHDIWQRALGSPLWRASVVAGPAPWQDPAELADEREWLPAFMWQRLFECQWCAADDALADGDALAECTRETPLGCKPGVQYVVTFDLGVSSDHSAVCVAHAEDRDAGKVIVIDRLHGWIPPAGAGQVDLDDVLTTLAALSAEYNGAPIAGDPWQAWDRIQKLRADGYIIGPVALTAQASSKRAQILMRLVRDRALSLPPDDQLRREFLSLRLAEGNTPGIVRLVSDGTSKGHFDRVTAIGYAAEMLLSRPGMSWRDCRPRTRQCEAASCGKWYIASSPACSYCGAPNPEKPGEQAAEPPRDYAPAPGGWASAYLRPGSRRCGRGHVYYGEASPGGCPACAGQGSGQAMPAAFARALQIGRRAM